jgi:transcriptional regulator with XRE-family HTH domain
MELARIMALRGVTDANLANALKCQRSTVLHWRTGNHYPRADMLKKICLYLECSSDELLGMEKSVGVPKARYNDLYKAITQRGAYDSTMIHHIATHISKLKGGKITVIEKAVRDIAEALYKIEMVARAPGLLVDVLSEFEQMTFF